MLTPTLRTVVAALATAGLATAGLLSISSAASAAPDTYVASYVPSVDGPIALSPSGALLAAADGSTVRLVWTSTETSATAPATLTGAPSALAFSADGSRLVVAEPTGLQVFAVSVTNGTSPTATLTPITGIPASQLAAPATTTGNPVLGLVALSTTSAIVLQDDGLGHGLLVVYSFPPSGTPAAPNVVSRPEYYTAIALSKDTGTLYAATDDRIVVIATNALTAAGTSIAMNAENTPTSLAVSPNGSTLAVGGSTALVAISTSSKSITATQLYPLAQQGYPDGDNDPTTNDTTWTPMPPLEQTACDSVAFSADSTMIYCTGPNLYWFAASSLDYRGALSLADVAGGRLPELATSATRAYVALGGASDEVESVPQALLTQASLPVGSTPGAPTNVTATAGTDQITVSWTAPASTGGLPLTGYTVTADPVCTSISVATGNCSGSGADVDTDTDPTNDHADDTTCSPGGTGTSCTITSLAPWVPYGVTVVAMNAKGEGSVATAPATVIPGIPGPPSGLAVAIGSDEALHVSWTPSTYNGAAPITGYQVWAKDTAGTAKVQCSYPSGETSTLPDATTCAIGPSGLTKGKTYEIDAVAVNHPTNGTSTQATASTTITYGAPSAPTNASVEVGDSSLVVRWEPPAYIGGTIKNYAITVSPGAIHCGTTLGVDSRSCTITGLTNGTHYSVSVVAVNSTGIGAPAVFSDVVPSTLPSSPSITDITSGPNTLTVSWQPPVSDGGLPIIAYTATAKVNQSSTPKTCTTNGSGRSCTITGLNNGVSYTVTVAASSNGKDYGMPSVAQTATPNGPPAKPSGVQATVKGAVVTVRWAVSTNTTITGYEVQTDTGEGCDVSGAGTSCTIEDLPAGTHNVTVWALSGSVSSDGSDPVSFTVLPKLGAPKVKSRRLDKRHHRLVVTLRWKAPKGFTVSGYRVERRNGQKRFVSGLTTTFRFKVGGYRNIRVVALNGDGESQPSNWRRILAH